MVSDDKVTAYLAEVEQRERAATPGPWWSDEDEIVWRLHGVAFMIPPQLDGKIPEQIVNKQIAKAPKSGTPYAEYWPDAADDAFIVSARSDIPRLLAAVRAGLTLADNWADVGPAPRPADEIQRRACAAELRAAITKALLAEDGT